MPVKPSGFICKFRWCGQLRAMVSANGHCEDFIVDGDCDRNLEKLWQEVLEKSEMLSGLKLSKSFDDMDDTIQFTVEGYSDSHSELAASLKTAVGDVAMLIDSRHKAILDCDLGNLSVATEAFEIARDLRAAADTLDMIGGAATEVVAESVPGGKKIDPVEEVRQWENEGGIVAEPVVCE